MDSLYGGYLSTFDHRWQPEGPQEKMIVTQARHVWTASYAAAFFEDDAYLPVAAHGFAFLCDVMWDSSFGGFYNLVSREGVVLWLSGSALANGWRRTSGVEEPADEGRPAAAVS